METAEVGRKKKTPAEADRKPIAVNIKGHPLWKEWLERLAKHARVPVATVVDQGVILFAKTVKFEEKPPERLP